MGVAQKVLLAAAPVIGILYILNVHIYLGFPGFWKQQYVGLFMAVVLASVFLSTPPTKDASRTKVPWYDFVFILLSFASGGYVLIFFPRELLAGLITSPEKAILGAILVLLALESARRLLGWVFVILTSAFILYAAYANLLPGFFGGKGSPWPLLMTHLYLDANSFLFFVGIAATLALSFILFGQAVFSFGGGKILGDFALSLMGRYRGGPAKVSVVGSSLFGTMSGSAISNIMVTGSITIPLMKRTGYQPHFAGAVEAAASNGGMLMPPVLGIVAFIMAEIIETPYTVIAIAALIPAVLYYFALFVQVDLEAAKSGLKGLPSHEIPPLLPVLKKSWVVLLPLAALIYTLFVISLPPAMAAGYSTLFGFLVFAMVKENRAQYWQRLLSVFKETGEILLNIGSLLICAGFIIAAVNFSGLATKMSISLVTLGGGNMYALLGIAAVASIVLGMGLPASASYILVAVLIAPALVEFGIPLLAAHLFVLYYANLALITPPIALGVFVAAPLAGADPMRTGFAAMRLAIVAYVVPFLFVFSPALLMQGPAWIIVMEVATAIIGTFALGIGLSGYFFRPLSWFYRLFILLAALALLISIAIESVPLGVALKLGGLLFVIPFIVWEWKRGTKALTPEAKA
jgi:TRAP transporter 4TM/12TM fusion protein